MIYPCPTCKRSLKSCPHCGGLRGFKTPTLRMQYGNTTITTPLTVKDLTPLGLQLETSPSVLGPDLISANLSPVYKNLALILTPTPVLLTAGDHTLSTSYSKYFNAYKTALLTEEGAINAELALKFGTLINLAGIKDPALIGAQFDDEGYLSIHTIKLIPAPPFKTLIKELDAATSQMEVSYRLAKWSGNIATGEAGWSVLLTSKDGKVVHEEIGLDYEPTAALIEALSKLNS